MHLGWRHPHIWEGAPLMVYKWSPKQCDEDAANPNQVVCFISCQGFCTQIEWLNPEIQFTATNFMSVAAESSDLGNRTSGANPHAEGHANVPSQSAKDLQESEALGSSPSHLPSWSPARRPWASHPNTKHCLEIHVTLTEDGQYHLVAYGSWALTAHDKNYHSTKLEILVLKWAIMEHFKEYLLYQPFFVRMDNNSLTYIMTTPNFDATGHWWVGALARFNFQLEYQKGWGNTVVDALSWITTCLSPEAVQSVLDGVTLGTAQRAEGHNPSMVEGNHNVEKEVHVTTR